MNGTSLNRIIQSLVSILVRTFKLNVKNHESDPSISCEVDPSFVPKNPDHLEGVETGG